jgi:S1-C subfamily serine protease
VDINTVLKYQGAQAAGTGMVLTSSGVILTNNHVIDGATSISVTVVSTGATYTAKVVGDDPTQDVAVLQLQNASGLQTAKLGDSNSVSVGQSVTGVGNAGGVGGTPSAAAGTVTALNQPITASDESGQNVQHLTGMIETNAGIQAGDSGGPLYDSKGNIIGMDSAASTGAAGTMAYAIPIDHAEQIAGQIAAGKASDTVHLGDPAFLGISIADTSVQGAAVASVLDGGPAQGAGITQGDVITAIAGTTIGSATDLQSALLQHKPGQTVNVTWTDQSGQSHTTNVTLATGPAL